VSYHFGGKRQLYRAVLRHAAATLAGPAHDIHADEATIDPHQVVARLLTRLQENRGLARLLLRDLADGGEMAVEALVPPVRAAFENLATSLGESDTLRPGAESRELFLTLAAPIVMAGAAAPLLKQVLEIDDQELASLLLHMRGRGGGNPSDQFSAG
jgi:AcrR family transcriptional regulator